MRIGLFLKYDQEVVKWSENLEISDLWGRVDRYGKGNTPFIAKFHRTDLVVCSHSREVKTQSYSQINMVLFNFYELR